MPLSADSAGVGPAPSFRQSHTRLLLGAVIGVAAILAGAAALTIAARSGGGETGSAAVPRMISSGDLAVIGVLAGHPVFWAGSRSGQGVQYSTDSSGNIRLRYLPPGTRPGATPGRYLDIGTFPFDGAYRATRRLALDPDLRTVRVGAGIGFVDPSRPYRVVLAWPSHPDLQVEVYDPVRYRALRVVRAGDIVPVP